MQSSAYETVCAAGTALGHTYRGSIQTGQTGRAVATVSDLDIPLVAGEAEWLKNDVDFRPDVCLDLRDGHRLQ